MIPKFDTFNNKYLRVATIPIVVVSGILTSSLIRNVINITLPELIAGLGAISLSIVWSMMRDGRGYWAYSVFTLRVYENPEIISKYRKKQLKGWMKILYQPFGASLVILGVVALLSGVIWLCGPAWRYPLIAMLGVLILPAVMLFQLCKAIPYYILFALRSRITPEEYQPRRRSLLGLVTEDLLLSLLINFALVLPIARKPAFSLDAGYANPAFIVAFIILMIVVLAFMLCFASRQRRYVIFGELLNGTLAAEAVPYAPTLFLTRLARPARFALWFIVVLVWSIAICLIFNALGKEAQFIPLYLCALLPLLAIYCFERYQTLYSNFKEAQEMRERYQIHADNIAKSMR